MKLLDVVREVRRYLEENGRVSLRMLRRQYELDDEALDELIEELVDVQRVARREENVLVWSAPAAPPTAVQASGSARPADQPVAPSADARKVVTILFADLAGSTGLHERLDPESVNAFMERYYQAMRRAVEAHRGTVVKFLGDGVMAAFGVPRVSEDDAMRAVRAAVAMQEAFRQLAGEQSARVGEIGLRVALNTGEVVVSSDNTDVVGDPVNVAARLQQEARNGDVVLGESTRRLVVALVTLTPLGSVTLKGRAEAVKAYRVESLERPVGTATAAFVGRDDELGRITAVYDAAIGTPAARLAVLLGSPGLGKSRMIEEFTRRLGDAATVLAAQCDAAGGATFAPLAEALRDSLGIAEGTGDAPPFEMSPKEGGSSGRTVGLSISSSSPISVRAEEAPFPQGPSRSPRPAIDAALPTTETDRDRTVAGITALLAGSPASPEETFFVIRRFLAALASVRPVVLVIDDLQWAEPLLLDLVEHLVQWGSGVPLLVLVGARPELRDVRSSLVTPGALVADVLTLSGLDAGAAMRLAANVIGAADLPAAVAAKVLATSEGNPLFVAELVRMLVQEGALTKEGDRWIPGVALAALEMPPTIHALLAARIERLRPEERSVLERAAVVGRHFSRSAVAELLPRDVTDLDARLEALRRSELIQRDTGWFLGEPVLRFHHILIRDAAYRRLLKGTRAELHARFADWVAARAGDAADHDETIGWHLEQAHQLLRELGALDQAGRALGERAAQHLAAAGRRALARDDLPVAADLLGRAVDRLDVDDAVRADLALDWCEALLAAGDVGPAAAAIDELGRFIGTSVPAQSPGNEFSGSVDQSRLKPTAKTSAESPSGDFSTTQQGNSFPGDAVVPAATPRLRAWHSCFASQLTVLTAPQELQAAADAVAAAAEELGKLGDAAGEAKAHSVHAQALARLGKVGACEAALDQALAAARRAGDRRRANAVLAGAPLAALWGPSPVTRASGRCLDVVRVLRITQGAPAVESVALSCQGVLEALRGRTEAARRMLASSRKMVEELGIAHRLFEADAFSGRIAAMEGDSAGAERLLRNAYEGLRDLGLGIDAARAGALLARTLLALDRVAEAESLSHESERLAGDDLQAAIAWRGVRAEALAKRGEHGAAVELAQAAVAIASATDALLDHADARMALAAALRAAGRGAAADAEERRAVELWEAKGATLLAAPGSVPVAEPIPAPRAVRRRVRPNAATSMQARFDAGLAARDFDAIAAVFHKDHREVDHPTGSNYGRGAAVASLQRLFRSCDPYYEVEPLATLGESLLLVRRRSGAAGTASARYDVGAYENEAAQLFEVDASGLCRSAEVFAVDHLGDAIVRLYERYAELLPEGPDRARAEATTRSVRVVAPGSFDLDGYAEVFRSDAAIVDHQVLGWGSSIGPQKLFRNMAAAREVGDQLMSRPQDVLALTHDALLLRWLASGVGRESGGAFEWAFLRLFIFDPDGRVARYELFGADREAQALARFEELAGTESLPLKEPAPSLVEGGTQEGFVEESSGQIPLNPPLSKGGALVRSARRRVRPNAATRSFERFGAAIAARDSHQLSQVFSESVLVVHHPTGSTYSLRAMLGAWRSAFRAERFTRRQEILATLGDALALGRHWVTIEGLTDAGVTAFGRVEMEEIAVVEVDDLGHCRHTEIFAADHLSAAITRLYERYTELLPEGPERARAAATARTVGVMLASPDDVDRAATVIAPDFESVDYRHLSTWSMRGGAAFLEHLRALREVAADVAIRTHDVLELGPDALLIQRMHSGTERLGGGTYERPFLVLFATDDAGRLTRAEWFEDDREAEALVRFEEIAGGERQPSVPSSGLPAHSPPLDPALKDGAYSGRTGMVAPPFEAQDRHIKGPVLSSGRALRPRTEGFENTASRAWREVIAVWRQRDLERFAALQPGLLRYRDHRRLFQLDLDREGFLAFTRPLLTMRSASAALELLATRGERLALMRFTLEMEDEVVGPSAIDSLLLIETDAGGAITAYDRYEIDDQEAARADIQARWESGEGARFRIVAWMRDHHSALVERRDWDAVAALYSPAIVGQDHRLVGWGTLRGRTDFLQSLRSMEALSSDARLRGDHMRACPRGSIMANMWVGTRDGGAFESPFLVVSELDADGKVVRIDFYDPHHFDRALARFEEIAAEPNLPAPFPAREGEMEPLAALVKPNLATASMERGWAAFDDLDLDAARMHFTPDFVWEDRRPMMGLCGDLDLMIASARERIASGARHERRTIVGTVGDRVAIARVLWAGGPPDGRFEVEFLVVHEVNEAGLHTAILFFDVDHEDAAKREAWTRWAAIDPVVAPWVELLTELADAWNSRDRPRLRDRAADDLVLEDHRHAGLGRIEGADAYGDSVVALWELAPDQRLEIGWSWPAVDRHGFVVTARRAGTLASGGTFESEYLWLGVGSAGRFTRSEFFEMDALDAALARFEELRPGTRAGKGVSP